MPKPRRTGSTSPVRIKDPPRHAAPLPAERVAEQPFCFDGRDRLIAPWPRNTEAMHDPLNQRRLLHVLDYVRAARPARACWLWPERKEPVPVGAPDLGRWLMAWARDRAVYVTR